MDNPAPDSPKTARVPCPSGFVELGYVSGAHGVRGDVKLRLHNPDSTTLKTAREVVLLSDEGAQRSERVVSARRSGGEVLLRLASATDRDAAQLLQGWRVLVPTSALPPLPEGEYYHHDLIGLEVVGTDGRQLGVLAEIFTTAAHDVYVVRREGVEELLVPAVEAFVERIDLPARRLVLRQVDDLL